MKPWRIDQLVRGDFQLAVSENLPPGVLASVACDGQAFIETSLFYLSMAALPIIETQQSKVSDCPPANRERDLGLGRRGSS